MKSMKLSALFLLITILLQTITSCTSDNGTKNPKDALSAFINNNDNVIAFGHVNFNDLLMKTDYESIPTFGNIISGQKEDLEKIIDFNSPVYYAVQGPITNNGEPETIYGFIKLKDKKSMIDKMTIDGYDFNELDEISYTEDGTMVFGIMDDIGVLIIKQGEFEIEKAITATFKSLKGKTSGGKIEGIIENTGDLVLGMNVASFYTSSKIDLSSLSEDKQKELKELVKDSYIQTVFKFENGAAIVETKNLFSSKLKDKLFFQSDKSAPINDFLGQGVPRMGFSMNCDMKKMNEFINEFSPEAISDIAKAIGPQAQIALMFSGSDGFAAFLDGRIGAVLFGELKKYDGEMRRMNAFVGLTNKGKDIVKDFGSSDMKYNNANLYFDKEGLSVSSVPDSKNNSMENGIELPEGCEKFGQSALSFFVNLEGVDLNGLELEGEENILRAVKYITFDYNNDGGVLYIKARKGQENILKQAMEIMIEEYSNELQSISI